MKVFHFGADQAFVQDPSPSLEMVLLNREQRVNAQAALAAQYPGYSVVSLKCNIPGAAKNNALIQYLCDEGVLAFQAQFDALNIVRVLEVSLATGPEAMFVVEADAYDVKRSCIALEDTHRFGRLYDFDVCVQDVSNNLLTVSRVALGVLGRRCFICNEDAKVCAKQRTHTVDALQLKILEYIETSVKFYDENN